MRRTWNTSVSSTIGIVVIGTAKIGFGPACAAAGTAAPAAAVSASAPVASSVRRSSEVMALFPSLLLLLANGKARAGHGPLALKVEEIHSVLDLRRQLAAIGGELGHYL